MRGAEVEWSWRDPARNLQELIFTCVRRALDRSEIEFGEVDGVVVAAHDLVDGRSLSSMVSAPAAGAYLRDEVRLGDDGALALAVAATRVRAGLCRNCIVAAWGRASEGNQEAIANALFDPFYAKPLALTEVAVSALRASAALRAHPGYRDDRAAAAEAAQAAARRAGRGEGTRPPLALPLRETELPVWSDVAAATVISAERSDLRIAGTGMSSEPYWPGDREMLRRPALAQASARALAEAGREGAEVTIAEIDGLTLFDEALGLEAAGLVAPGGGMRALARRERHNASGGYAAGYCAPAMGLVRTIEAGNRLRSEAGPESPPRLALASGSSTVAGQTQAAVVLEAA